MADRLVLALVRDVFPSPDSASDRDRLHARLVEARAGGAHLAVLPELPLNPWSPATKERRDEDAEEPDGPRARLQQDAAARAGIALIGGVIRRDPATGRRENVALVIGPDGTLVADYAKAHLPEEPGFWETSHYESGTEPARPIHVAEAPLEAWPFGVQICSDVNRPEGSHLLGAMGAGLVVAPRATEAATWERWRPVLVANALTSRLFVASVNRPGPERGVGIGGPDFVVGPTGDVLFESDAHEVAIVPLDRRMLDDARRAYPGYLPVRADLYARAWQEAASSNRRS